MADPLVQAMGIFNGIGLIVAFLIFTRLAVKARSLGSFRFQLSIFMLIWAAAEIPRVTSSLGLFTVAGFGLYGLTLHMISMFAFALFIGAKSYNFLRTPVLPVQNLSPSVAEPSMRESLP